MTRGTTLREAFGSLGRCGSVSKVRVGEAITGLGRVETIGERCRLAGNIPVGRNFGNLAGLPPRQLPSLLLTSYRESNVRVLFPGHINQHCDA